MDLITTKNMKEYDAHAREWYQAMATNAGHIFLEKPAMEQCLPDNLSGMKVLCVGVGSGEELAKIISLKPQKIVAIDVSIELIKIARTHFPEVEFFQMDMTALQLPEDFFDLVYSSLAFHYAKDWDQLLSGIKRVLKKNGVLLFSTHNPEFWNQFPKTGNSYKNECGVLTWEHVAVLPGNINATYYNVSNSAVIESAVKNSGFTIEKLYYPEVIACDGIDSIVREDYLRLIELNKVTPLFLVIKALKM